MRVLHLHSGNLYGGVETVIHALARCRFLAPSMQPRFALGFDGRLAQQIRDAGCPVHILGPVRARYPHTVVRARACLARLCSDERVDVTMVHSTWSLAVLAPAATRPLALYRHDVAGDAQWTVLSRRNPPDLILANSSFTAADATRRFRRVRVVRVHPPCLLAEPPSDDLRDSIRRDRGVSESSLVILQAGRFESWKGQALLLRSLALLRHRPEWTLWFAGEPQRPAEARFFRDLVSLAAALGVSNRVSFLGHIDDMPALMSAADIYCQPNLRPEPFGLSFVEALHARLPVVASALGGASEILAPDWGLLAAPNCHSVAAAIAQLLDNPTLRRNLAETGPLRAAALSDPRAQLQAIAAALEPLSPSLRAA